MISNEKKDKVQRDALAAWEKANKVGTCEIITGLGKTFIGLHALYTIPKDNKIHLFLAETVDRETDLKKDVEKYNKIFGRDVFKDYNLEFYCYQTVYKWRDRSFGLVIADEIHDSLSLEYCKFYRYNKYDAIIGLSATVQLTTKYVLASGRVITKEDILNKVAPICFSYKLSDAKDEGTSRNLNIYVVKHSLDNNDKYVAAGSVKKRFFQTEKASYLYWDKRYKQSFFLPEDTQEDYEKKQNIIRASVRKRTDILYNMKSKINVVKKLLNNIDGKTIIFGNSIDCLLKITPNVVSSRNKADENKRIRDAFDKGKLNRIASFKKLKQGANLEELDNVIIMSYYSTNLDLIQRIGRLRDNGKIGNVIILLTEDTQEEAWYTKMIEEAKNFNIIQCPDIDYCIKKINKK